MQSLMQGASNVTTIEFGDIIHAVTYLNIFLIPGCMLQYKFCFIILVSHNSLSIYYM